MSAADQIQSLRIIRPSIEKSFQRVTRVAVLSRGDISRANLAPDFVQSMRLIALDDFLEMCDGIRQTILDAGNAAQLVMRVQFVRVDIDRAMKTLARLMNQTQVVMGRRITRIDGSGFQVLLKGRARALLADDVGEIAAQQEESEQEQKWRSEDCVKNGIEDASEWQTGQRGQEQDRDSTQDRDAENNPHGREPAEGEKSKPDRIEEVGGNENRIGKLGLNLRDLISRQSKPKRHVLQLFSALRLRSAGNIGCLKSTEVKKDRDQDGCQRRCSKRVERDCRQRAILLLKHDTEAAPAIEQIRD